MSFRHKFRFDPLILAALFVVGNISWIEMSGVWADISRPPRYYGAFLDLFVVGYLAACFLRCQRSRWLGGAVFATLSLLFLAASCLKYQFLGHSLSFNDVRMCTDLVAFYGVWAAAGFALGVGVPIALALINIRLPMKIDRVFFAPLLASMLILGVKTWIPLPRSSLSSLQSQTLTGLFPPPLLLGHVMGFYADLLLYLDTRSDYGSEHDARPPFDYVNFLESKPVPVHARNVHLIVVESMMDLAAQKGMVPDLDPLAPLLPFWVPQGKHMALSPVFGNRSADAEFEALCGMPAQADNDRVIFSTMRSKELRCLPAQLKALGYQTLLTVPVEPTVFEYGTSYRAVGFDHLLLSPQLNLDDNDGHVPSDASLLEQATAELARMPHDRPIFNYIATQATHAPFIRNETKRPNFISVTPDSFLLTQYANSLFYTSKFIANFILEQREKDPSAIFIVVGDHQPPLAEVVNSQSPFSVPLLVISSETPQWPAQYIPHFLIPEILMDLLSDGRFCQVNRCRKSVKPLIRPLEKVTLLSDETGIRYCPRGDTTASCQEAEEERKFLHFERRRLTGSR